MEIQAYQRLGAFNPIGCLVGKSLSIQHSHYKYFLTACESTIIKVVHFLSFLPARGLPHEVESSVSQSNPLHAIVCSANRRLNRAVSLWVSLASYSHFFS
jgi:hypothetical protein